MGNSLNTATSTNATQESELTLLNASSAAWDGNLTTVKANSAGWTTGPTTSGRVIQVVTVTTDAISFSTTSASNVDITGLVASITPSASSSKILVTAVVNCGGSDNNGVGLGLTRGGSRIGDSTETPGSSIRSVMAGCKLQDGNDIITITLNYLDSPSTASAAEYKVQVSNRTDGGTFTFRLNRSNDHNNQSCLVTASSITLMEITG